MQLSIIIVNYNVKYFLEHCLLSVLKACSNINAEIIVVDNNSTDDSKVYLEQRFNAVKFLWNSDNIGFAKANNSALKYASGEYILFLNPDTIVPEDCFTKCLDFFEKTKNCGALGVRMVDGAGNFLSESKRCLPTPLSGFFKMFGFAKFFPNSKIFSNYYAGYLPENENNKVDVLAGAFMMLGKNTIEKTKGFDEDFFMYGEDIDLSYRITKAGLQNYYIGEVSIIHFKGESTQKKSASYILNFYGATKLFIDKHYKQNKITRFFLKFFVFIGELIAKIRSNTIINVNDKYAKKEQNTFVFCSKNQKENIGKLLDNTNFNVVQYFFDDLNFEKTDKNLNTIILAEGFYTNKIIIEQLAYLPKKSMVLFYQSNALSLIGSNNKNTKGIFVANV
ncbi:MAG: glycosyltransferase family 2 protein [Ferruginibacter sp.]|nr:glycosyltransferase family 2 protein [Ferruginibacter sp.]